MKTVIYLSVSLGLLIYALPRLEVGNGPTLPTLFSIVWISFMLLVIAAQLYEIVVADSRERASYAKLKRLRKWQMERTLQGAAQLFRGRK